MIKHRFIVSETDFRIFAAIPTELRLLTWKKWRRPPDWPMLRTIFETSAGLLAKLGDLWARVSKCYRAIADMEVPGSLVKGTSMNEREAETRRTRANQSEETAMLSNVCLYEADRSRQLASLLDSVTDDDDPAAASSEVRKFLVRVSGGVSTGSVDDLVRMAREHCTYYEKLLDPKNTEFFAKIKILGREDGKAVIDSVANFYNEYDILLRTFNHILEGHKYAATVVRGLDLVNNPELPADLECPVGVPFAAYTVELGEHVVVNIIEGHAWIENRQESEAEIRATEIVSQMMVERGLNPKAPTRISIREVDPSHAHEQRAAEARGGSPKVRTIKFYVSPPRYLREAAEEILRSPRRAHWVVGHWRNQPYGHGRELHKQTWIKPHIRGLGEAGATTTKVVAAPKPKEHAR